MAGVEHAPDLLSALPLWVQVAANLGMFVVAVAMAVFLTGAALWVVDGGPGPRGLFHIGSIDIVELIALAASLALAGRAVERTGNAVRVPAPR